MKTVQITDEQEIDVILQPKTLAGNDAQVDGEIRWTQTSGDATITTADGGKKATISAGTPGQVNTFEVEADADLGEGEVKITETIVVTVGLASAAGFGAEFGEPRIKPELQPQN
jgi:hypothetical protein